MARLLCAFDQQLHSRRQPLPAFQLAFELFPPLAGQRVELCIASEIGRLPFGADPALMLETMQRGIQRALSDRQRVAREELDALGDAPAVQRRAGDGLPDEQIQGALEQIRRFRQLTPRLSTIIPRLSTARKSMQSGCAGRRQPGNSAAAERRVEWL